ncbi:MAG: hypothetical protein NTU76_01035 [Candidatus Taylorbacteria bacterium]|nr:hypothetical protein [Candidatus Taylorbacteria bacterium]
MKKFKLEEIEDILKIKGHNYPLNKEEIEEYFNYLVSTLKIDDPVNFLAKKCCLGVSQGLYLLMYGKDLKDILDNFKGTEKDKKDLLRELSLMHNNFLLEVSILGQLSRNGCKIGFYEHLDGKNPDASVEVNGKKYILEVTLAEITYTDEKSHKKINIIEAKGSKWFDRYLMDRIEREATMNQFNNKTLIISPKNVFSEFWSRIQKFEGSLSDFFINSDEVEIFDEILTGDKVLGVSYELKGDGYSCKFVIKSTFGYLLNTLSDKNKQFRGSSKNFILYIEIARMDFMGIGDSMIVELQHYLKRFPNCAAVVLCERFAIDYQEKSPSLFSECYFVANGNCKDVIDPRTPDGEYDFKDIDKLILRNNTHFIITKDGDRRFISKRSFVNKYK